MIAPEADSRSPVAETNKITEPRVVHQGAEACLTAAGQLETPALRQVTQAEEDVVLAGESERGAHDLDQAPPRGGLDPDLNGVADVLVLNRREGAQDQLLVVRVDEAQARDADVVCQRPTEQAFCGGVAPARRCPPRRR